MHAAFLQTYRYRVQQPPISFSHTDGWLILTVARIAKRVEDFGRCDLFPHTSGCVRITFYTCRMFGSDHDIAREVIDLVELNRKV